jgi:HAD superfamily hydrolase (TIGR01450 family)
VLLLVDLDGVVYRASQPVPGVGAALAGRAAIGDDVVYVTNNSMYYHTDYLPRLEGVGAPTGPDRVVTSARATALYLRDEMPDVRRVLAVGAGGLDRELREASLDVVNAGYAATRISQEGIDGWEAAGHPDAVVVGLDPQLTYLRVAAAADCVRAGATLIATNRDPIYPIERGYRPGAGSIVVAVEVAAKAVAVVTIGKPEPYLLAAAAHLVGGELSRAVMIGDALTDIAAGRAVGARTVLMLTGVTTREAAESLSPEQRPTFIAEDGEALARALSALDDGSATARAGTG